MEELRLAGEKVYLRPMTIEDTDKIVRWRNNPRVRKNFIYQKPFTRQGHLTWIEEKVNTGEVIQFIICEKGTDRPVGSVYFRDINAEHRRAEYGIFIGEDDAAGCGFGSETCLLACEYGFSVEKWHKIILRAFSDNQAAIRSYEKAGFVREAYLKDEVCIDGTYRDMVLMGFINPEERKG
ncbi:MAG: GNAT family N-acetyltransferase [Lachnospiraceae bacterium]|nr:GNAT family N-acetyltransferase [Lachnospiraceae bacterium]